MTDCFLGILGLVAADRVRLDLKKISLYRIGAAKPP